MSIFYIQQQVFRRVNRTLLYLRLEAITDKGSAITIYMLITLRKIVILTRIRGALGVKEECIFLNELSRELPAILKRRD